MKQSRITITIHAEWKDGRGKRGLMRMLKEDIKIYKTIRKEIKKVRVRVEDK